MEFSLQVVKTLLAISVFLAFVAWDVGKACKRGDKWIQSRALTLSALTVQFLVYFDAQNVNLFAKSKETELEMLLKKQLSVDMARLVFCTFLGCVLPGVAFHGSEGRWSSIAAVAVSLCMHMATEVYVLQNVDDPTFRNGGRTMFISSSVLLLMAAISLVLYLGLAVINCKFARDRLSLRIPILLSGKTESEIFEGKDRDDVFKCWAVVRGCQQEFWLVSSALSPAVLMIVTTCVVVVFAKAISRPSLLHYSNNNVTLCLQCVFILTGWIILIWRWVKFLLVHLTYKSYNSFTYVGTTKVYEIRFCRLVYLFILQKLYVRALDNVSRFKLYKLVSVRKVWRILALLTFPVVIFPMSLFIVVICLLMLFHFFCWFLSSLLVRIAIHCVNRFKDLGSYGEVKLSTEQRIKTETDEWLYVAESSNQETRRVMEEAYDKGQNSQKLLEVIKLTADKSRKVIRDQLSDIEIDEYAYEYQGVWKMAAVAAISLIVELAYDRDRNEIVKDVVQAYWEAQDLLEFLDFPDNITVNPMNLFDSGNSRAYQMSLEADIKMQKIESLVEKKGEHRSALRFEDVAEVVRKFAKEEDTSDVNNKFCQYWSGNKPIDSLEYGEGTDLLKQFSMGCVCEAISMEPYSNERELVDGAVRCLGDIIACAVLKLPEVLPQHCRKWAEEFKEENLIKALEIQEKFRAVKEKWTSADSAAASEAEENKLPEDIIASGILHLQDILTQYCSKWTEDFLEENYLKAFAIQEKFKAIEDMLTSTDTTAPKGISDENKLAEDSKVDVDETETRNHEFNGAERDIESEIIDLEAR